MISVTYYFLPREKKKSLSFTQETLNVSSDSVPPLVACSFRRNGWAEASDCISVLKPKPKFSLSLPPYCFLLNLTTDEEVEAQSDMPEAFKVSVQRNRQGLYATDPTYAHKTGETLHMGLLSITMQREGTRSTAPHTNSPLNVRHKQDAIYGRDPGCYLKHSIPQIVTKPPHLKSSL